MNRVNYLEKLKSNVEAWEKREKLDPLWPRCSMLQAACRMFLVDFINSDSCDVESFYNDNQFLEFKAFLGKFNSITQDIIRNYVLRFVRSIDVDGLI